MKNYSLFDKFRNINPDVLKIIALITMTIDHIGHVLFPGKFLILRYIGRLALPLFCFLFTSHLAQNPSLFKKYTIRLIPFAFLSLIMVTPFEYFIKDYFKLSILFSFLLYLTVIFLISKTIHLSDSFLQFFLSFIVLFVGAILSGFVDYGFLGYGFTLIMYLYLKTKNVLLIPLCLIAGFFLNIQGYTSYPSMVLTMSSTSLLTTCFCLMQTQDKKIKHKRFLKPWWLFYAYFPIHFFILYLIYIIIH